jgi:hypothetical protein
LSLLGGERYGCRNPIANYRCLLGDQHHTVDRRDACPADAPDHHPADADARGEDRFAARNALHALPPPVVLLDIDWDGTPEWNDRPVDRATLDAYLVHAAHQDPQPELHIHADRFAKYDAVALVISDAARLGEKRIVFNNIGLP